MLQFENIKVDQERMLLPLPGDLSIERWTEITFDVDIAIDRCPYNEYFRRTPQDQLPAAFFYEVRKRLPQHLDMSILNGIMFDGEPINFDDLDRALREHDSTKIRVLDSHGNNVGFRWVATEYGKEGFPIYEWIERYSGGEYGALIIEACNPGRVIPRFRGTPIFYSKGISGNPFWCTNHLADSSNFLSSTYSRFLSPFETVRTIINQTS